MYCPKPNQYRFSRLSVKSPQGEYNVTPGEESCSTGISNPGDNSCSTGIGAKLDIDRDTENICRSPGGNGCSTSNSSNPSKKRASGVKQKRRLVSQINSLKKSAQHRAMQRLHEFAPRLQLQQHSKCYQKMLAEFEAEELEKCWEQLQALERELQHLVIRIEQQDYRKLLTVDPNYLSETNGQLTIFSEDEPPEPDDFKSLEEFEQAWTKWEQAYPKLAEAVRQMSVAIQPPSVEQNHQATGTPARATEEINHPQSPHSLLPTPHCPIKTRNTKPGRGSRPKQVKCNVKRNSSKGKSANTYWVYKFSFKVDGKYYDRSVSIPKEKVYRVIEMWESKQYCWIDIVEYIGKNPDKIIEKFRRKQDD